MLLKDLKYLRISIAIAIALSIAFWIIPIIPNSSIEHIKPWISYEFLFRGILVLLFLSIIGILYYRKLIDIINSQHLERNLLSDEEHKIMDKDIEKDFFEALSELTGDEKNILKQYIEKDIRSLPFGLYNGTVRSLMERNILFLPSGPWPGWRDPSFSIDPTVMKILKQNQNFLK